MHDLPREEWSGKRLPVDGSAASCLPRDRYRVGVIGAGAIAFGSHVPVLLNTAGAAIAWIMDRDEKRARRVARCFGVPHARGDLETLPDADVVLVTIPYGARAPLYEALGRRFPAIYVEKPLALTLAEHDRLCALWAG